MTWVAMEAALLAVEELDLADAGFHSSNPGIDVARMALEQVPGAILVNAYFELLIHLFRQVNLVFSLVDVVCGASMYLVALVLMQVCQNFCLVNHSNSLTMTDN